MSSSRISHQEYLLQQQQLQLQKQAPAALQLSPSSLTAQQPLSPTPLAQTVQMHASHIYTFDPNSPLAHPPAIASPPAPAVGPSPYVSVFGQQKRNLFSVQSPNAADHNASPSTPSRPGLNRPMSTAEASLAAVQADGYGFDPNAHPQLQQQVDDVASSRFSSLLPASPYASSARPVSVLNFDNMDVVVSHRDPDYIGPNAVTGLSGENGFGGQQVSPPRAEIIGVTPAMRRTASSNFPQLASSAVASSSSTSPLPEGSAINVPFKHGPAADGEARAAAAPGSEAVVIHQAPAHGEGGNINRVPVSAIRPMEDLNAIEIKIGSCFDLSPSLLLIVGLSLVFLMLLFTCISFGVNWTTASTVDGDYAYFYIGHYKQGVPFSDGFDLKYVDDPTHMQECKIDNIRIPVCLGLSIPLLFAVAFCLWKRSSDHSDVTYRRGTIFFLVIYGMFTFLSVAFWWYGSYTYIKGASGTTTSTGSYTNVSFSGGWWLSMFNIFVTFLLIIGQGIFYGEAVCCKCTC